MSRSLNYLFCKSLIKKKKKHTYLHLRIGHKRIDKPDILKTCGLVARVCELKVSQ